MMKILNANCRLLAVLLLLVLEACTDYASKMEDDFEEWKAAQAQLDEGEVVVSSSSITPKSRSSETIVSSSSPVPVVDPSTVVMGEMTDARDGQTYKIVSIGSQTWMAENLNYETENSYCYNDSVKYCAKYGRLYVWHIAATVCPSGWHLPDTTEWNTLFAAVGGQSTAGKMLKSTSANGTNAYAFSALPAGYRNYSGGYNYKDSAAYFWGSTKYDNLNANCAYLLYDYDNAHHHYQYYTPYSMNVRCVKDENSSSITPQ